MFDPSPLDAGNSLVPKVVANKDPFGLNVNWMVAKQPNNFRRLKRNGIGNRKNFWPNATIPYAIA